MSVKTKAGSSAKAVTKSTLSGILKQLAPLALGIFISELDRKFLNPEHVAMIEEHNSSVEEISARSSPKLVKRSV